MTNPLPPLTKADLIVVDDTPENLQLLSGLLNRYGYKVRSALDGYAALKAASAAPPDLILMDIRMPGLDGYEVCEQLKENEATRDIPVIFLSSLNEVIDKVRAFTSGGVDYVTKPFQIEEVLARIETHLTLRSLQKTLQKRNAELEEKNAQLEQEIARRTQAEEKMRILAITDPLTSIFNRRHFFELAEKELQRSRRYQRPLSVIMFDLDHFKRLNDTYGHLAGDYALKEVVHVCQHTLRDVDLFARYGGEEFVILLPETDSNQAHQVAERLRTAIDEEDLKWEEKLMHATISLGVTSLQFDADNLSADKLLDQADQALYHSKNTGRNRVSIYSPQLSIP